MKKIYQLINQKNLYQKYEKNDYKSFSGRSVNNEGYNNQVLVNNSGNPIGLIQDDVNMVKDKGKGYYSGKEEEIKKIFVKSNCMS